MRPPKAERNAALVERYKQGVGAYRIGREFGITYTRVYQILKREGIERRKRDCEAVG